MTQISSGELGHVRIRFPTKDPSPRGQSRYNTVDVRQCGEQLEELRSSCDDSNHRAISRRQAPRAPSAREVPVRADEVALNADPMPRGGYTWQVGPVAAQTRTHTPGSMARCSEVARKRRDREDAALADCQKVLDAEPGLGFAYAIRALI